MEELEVGSEITLKVVEDNSNDCNGCFFDELARDLHDETCKSLKCSRIDRKDGKGAKWAINEVLKNLWHSIEKNPKKYHKCLVEVVYHRPLNMTDEVDYVTSHLTNFGWDESSFKRSDYTIKRWIYIDDLLKGCNHD